MVRLLEVGVRLARQAHLLLLVRRERPPTATMAARAVAVAVRLCRLPRTALRAALAGLAVAVAVAVAVAAIRALAARVASVVTVTAS